MKRLLEIGLGVATGLALCAGAQAQIHGGHGGFGHSGFGHAPIGTLHGGFPVPGFGFDFTHHAAINRDIGVRALIDPVTQAQLALAQQIHHDTPIFPFAFSFFPSTTPVIVIQQQPPVVVVQQPAAPQETVQPAVRTRYLEPRENVEPARPPEPPREVGEFVLVRRDGKVLFAVAFFAEGDRLTYITREGVRRFFPLAELDIDSTRRMNEERGTTLHLPV